MLSAKFYRSLLRAFKVVVKKTFALFVDMVYVLTQSFSPFLTHGHHSLLYCNLTVLRVVLDYNKICIVHC